MTKLSYVYVAPSLAHDKNHKNRKRSAIRHLHIQEEGVGFSESLTKMSFRQAELGRKFHMLIWFVRQGDLQETERHTSGTN
jgi:hypothetical protein